MNAPKRITWLISFILIVLAIVAKFVAIPFVSANGFWVLAVGAVLLLLGTLFKGL